MSPLFSTTLRIGDPAPEFILPDLDGRPFELADVLLGGPVLLVFAPGIWSPATRRQIIELEAAQEALQKLQVTLLMVSTEEERQARRALSSFLALDRSLREPLLSFPILVDRDRETARDYGVYRAISWSGLRVTRPAAFFIDATGCIRFAYVGQGDADTPDIPGVVHLARALAGFRPAPALLLPGRTGRLIREWDPAALPRVDHPRRMELEPPGEVIPLPAAAGRAEVTAES